MYPSDCLSAVSSALSQKCSGSSYPYIRNGFFKLSVIQAVSNITQIALRKLRNKNTIFLSYHQTFSSRFFEFYLHTEYHGLSRIFLFLSRIIELSNFIFLVPRLVFCPELSNFRIFVFRDFPWFSVWLKEIIRKFANSWQRLFRDSLCFSVWLKEIIR